MTALLEQLDAEIEWTEKRLVVLRQARVILAQDDPVPHRMPRAQKAAPRKPVKPPPNPSGKKRCSKCDKEKARAEFSANKARGDGLQTWCRSCQRERFAQIRRGKKPRAAAKAEEPEPVRAPRPLRKAELEAVVAEIAPGQNWRAFEPLAEVEGAAAARVAPVKPLSVPQALGRRAPQRGKLARQNAIAKAQDRGTGMLRCRLPAAASATTANLSGGGALCGMVLWRRELGRHLLEVHALADANDQLLEVAFGPVAEVKDDEEAVA